MAGKAPILACITLALTLSAAFIQPPQITVQDPSLLYTLALYKSFIGDPAAALRLLRRAEESKLRRRTASQPRAEAVCAARSVTPAFEGAQ